MQSGKDKIYGGTGDGGEGEPCGRVWAKIKQKSEQYKGGKADEEEKERVRCVLLEARQGQKVTESWAGSEGKAGGIWCMCGCVYKGVGGIGVRWSRAVGLGGVCQYRCSVTGCHNSGQEAESND